MKQAWKPLVFCTIFYAATTLQTNAEPYIGGTLGLYGGQNISNIKGNENLNYPDAPDNTDPTSALLPNAKYSSVGLKPQGMLGLKGGYYFDELPFFGLEGEFLFSRSRFKQQSVTITHPGIAAVTGGAPSFTETQLPAEMNMYVLAVNAMLRYPTPWHGLTPYVGGGPAVFFTDISGTGYSGIIPALGQPGTPGPEISQHPVIGGVNFKAGAEYRVTQNWGLGLEYRYNWAAFHVDNFRSTSDAGGDFQSHALELTVNRHF